MVQPMTAYLLAGCVALLAGIDRTAALQVMISRPVVAAPLAGWLLGDPAGGLLAGALIELLWLGRLPVGAAIPPDDTQVAIGAAALAAVLGPQLQSSGPAFTLLCILVAMPLGKVGQLFDREARHWNDRLLQQVQTDLSAGNPPRIDRRHLAGVRNFALASLATYLVIVSAGTLLVREFTPLLLPAVASTGNWLQMAFPLVGSAAILGSINVTRALTLFSASFGTALLMLWLAR